MHVGQALISNPSKSILHFQVTGPRLEMKSITSVQQPYFTHLQMILEIQTDTRV